MWLFTSINDTNIVLAEPIINLSKNKNGIVGELVPIVGHGAATSREGQSK